MTKKDFKAIAEVLRSRLPANWDSETLKNADPRDLAVIGATIVSLTYILARLFEENYPLFDRQKFLEAAGQQV